MAHSLSFWHVPPQKDTLPFLARAHIYKAVGPFFWINSRKFSFEIEEVYKLRCIEHDNDKPFFTPTYTWFIPYIYLTNPLLNLVQKDSASITCPVGQHEK